MAQLGFRTLKEMVGQTHKINAAKAQSLQGKGLDLSAIFTGRWLYINDCM